MAGSDSPPEERERAPRASDEMDDLAPLRQLGPKPRDELGSLGSGHVAAGGGGPTCGAVDTARATGEIDGAGPVRSALERRAASDDEHERRREHKARPAMKKGARLPPGRSLARL